MNPATNSVAVIWSENDPDDDWQIFFNRADNAFIFNPTLTEQITFQAENLNCFLPQIDIAPESSGVHQAVVTWTTCYEVAGEYTEPGVMISSTPFLVDSQRYITESVNTQISDVVCYEAELAGPGSPDEHWFG